LRGVHWCPRKFASSRKTVTKPVKNIYVCVFGPRPCTAHKRQWQYPPTESNFLKTLMGEQHDSLSRSVSIPGGLRCRPLQLAAKFIPLSYGILLCLRSSEKILDNERRTKVTKTMTCRALPRECIALSMAMATLLRVLQLGGEPDTVYISLGPLPSPYTN